MNEEQFLKAAKKVSFLILAIIPIMVAGCPYYDVWHQGMIGEGELNRAGQNRKIAIEEAEAKKASAKLLAEAEVERAKGVAQANEIIGDSLKGNDSYLQYLWIQGLQDGTSEVIYVPTEGQLPILEAGRLSARDRKDQ